MKRDIVIYLPRVTATYYEVEGYGIALCVFVRDAGGRAAAFWGYHGVSVRIQGLPRKLVRVGTKVLIDSTIAAKGTLSVVEREEASAPLPDLQMAIPWGTVFLRPPRLTKRLIYLLPRRAYVVSHRSINGQAVFAEKLGNHRDFAWQRAVEAKAAGRSCHLAWSVRQFNEERCLWPKVASVK